MNDFITVIVTVLSCMCTFCAGYAAGIAYAVSTLKKEGEKK